LTRSNQDHALLFGATVKLIPGDLLGERVLKVGQLLQEACVGSDRPPLTNSLQSPGGCHVLLHHEIGGNTGRRPGPAHDTVDDDQSAAGHAVVDELSRAMEISGNVGTGEIINVEPVVLDSVDAIF